jgi:hypothetical protein
MFVMFGSIGDPSYKIKGLGNEDDNEIYEAIDRIGE